MKIAIANGIAVPTTYFPNEEDIGQIGGKVRFPAIVKPNISHAAIGLSMVNSKDELIRVYQETRRRFGESTVQNYIRGGKQYKAEMVVDRRSEVKAGIVYAKLRYYPPMGGSSTLDCTVERKDILQIAGKMLKAMGWYGVADLDFIEDPADGIPRLMEINPRYTRTIKIATVSGLDFPYIAYKVARDEEVPLSIDYKIGRCLRFLPEDVLWFLASPERWSSKPSFFRFIDINTRGEIMSWADPGPALAFFIDGILMMLNRKERDNILRKQKKVF
jgi:predicted ATP-grasp superfamily ATP-dependent carboligase